MVSAAATQNKPSPAMRPTKAATGCRQCTTVFPGSLPQDCCTDRALPRCHQPTAYAVLTGGGGAMGLATGMVVIGSMSGSMGSTTATLAACAR